MADLILTLVVLAAAAGFAWWYLRRAEAQRAEREAMQRRDEQRELASATGLAAGDRGLWDPSDPDPLARKILDDGFAHNSKHVDRAFRDIYWRIMDGGGGMDAAFRTAMAATKWRRGSRGQVYDRLHSHGIIDESTRELWKREDELAGVPDGYGRYS